MKLEDLHKIAAVHEVPLEVLLSDKQAIVNTIHNSHESQNIGIAQGSLSAQERQMYELLIAELRQRIALLEQIHEKDQRLLSQLQPSAYK